MAVVLYYLVSFLSDLSGMLGLTVIGIVFLYRFNKSNFWMAIGNTPQQVSLVSFVGLSTPVVVGIVAYALGLVPAFTVEEWTILTLYASVVWAGAVTPVDSVSRVIDDALETQAIANARFEQLSERYQKLRYRTPEPVTIDIDLDYDLSTLQGAQMAITGLEAMEEWLDQYEACLETREKLATCLDESVRDQAIANDTLAARVATLTENSHPKHYDTAETAASALKVLETVVTNYEQGHLPSDFLEDDTADLLEVAGPRGKQLTRIESNATQLPA
ncbi:hypothetical protein C486_05764 [Natrinema gari JCM 14663]|uniref:Uncharacterized protein n=2 Tax=Natrinema gari TaxID=419186 RepID=L9Z711_9EURY|nr:hypothetical protein C486_05764 [Natrinema gari JCM 14663]